MAGRRRRERTIFLPWERRGVFRALQLPRRRATAWGAVLVAIALIVLLDGRNRRARSVRITRATIEHTRAAIDAFRADHDGRCPRDLAELGAPADHGAYVDALPRDAWGAPLRLDCPSHVSAKAYDLVSDGPDRQPYGLDRIE